MLLPILKYPDNRLRRVSELVTEVTDDVRQLVDDMAETMFNKNGLGLAAPQIGVAVRMFIMAIDISPGFQVFINPKVLSTSQESSQMIEGCLSFPGVPILATCFNTAKVEFSDLQGQVHARDYDGIQARCIQHEINHLDGKLIIDHVDSYLKRQMIEKKLNRYNNLVRGIV